MDSKSIAQINKVIKAAAKSQNLTYSQLARRLGVSEPTIKRWFRGEGISIQQWMDLIDAIGIRLSDVAAALDERPADQFEYSETQEKALSSTVGLLAFFQALLSGHSPGKIMRDHSLTQGSVSAYLKQLDAIGLIQWTEGLTCRLKVQGEPRWRKKGALSKKFQEQLFNHFMWARRNEDCFRLGIYELTRKDHHDLTEELEKVFDAAGKLEKKARLLKLKTETVCLGTCLDRHSPEFLYKIPNYIKRSGVSNVTSPVSTS